MADAESLRGFRETFTGQQLRKFVTYGGDVVPYGIPKSNVNPLKADLVCVAKGLLDSRHGIDRVRTTARFPLKGGPGDLQT